MSIVIRHGDVGFHSVKKITGEIIKHNGKFIVEYGTATGHGHLLTVRNINDLEIKKDTDGIMYLNLKKDGVLTHEEHKTITIPKGIYKKVIEQEKDWFIGAVRQVVD